MTAPQQDATPAAPENTSPAQGESPKEKAPAPKPETDWKAEARKWEERAKENKGAAERLTAIEEANKTEAQKLADRAAAAEKQAAETGRALMRYRVAAEKQLPAELVERLRGDTVEEMAQDADALLALVKPVVPEVKPDGSQGTRGSGSAPDMNSLLRAAAGRG